MSFTRPFDADPTTGLRETFVGHEKGFSIVTTQDCEGVLGSVRAARDAQGSTRCHDFRLVASIPLAMAQQWATESGTTIFSPEYNEYVRKNKLNSNEFQKLRIWEGRV